MNICNVCTAPSYNPMQKQLNAYDLHTHRPFDWPQSEATSVKMGLIVQLMASATHLSATASSSSTEHGFLFPNFCFKVPSTRRTHSVARVRACLRVFLNNELQRPVPATNGFPRLRHGSSCAVSPPICFWRASNEATSEVTLHKSSFSDSVPRLDGPSRA